MYIVFLEFRRSSSVSRLLRGLEEGLSQAMLQLAKKVLGTNWESRRGDQNFCTVALAAKAIDLIVTLSLTGWNLVVMKWRNRMIEMLCRDQRRNPVAFSLFFGAARNNLKLERYCDNKVWSQYRWGACWFNGNCRLLSWRTRTEGGYGIGLWWTGKLGPLLLLLAQ